MDQATAGAVPRPAGPRNAPAATRAREGRPLRVAMVTSVFPPSIGGIQMHTLRLAQALVDRGVEVHVVTRLQPRLAPFERMRGVRVRRVGLARAGGPAGSAAFVAGAIRALARLRGRLDVVHAHQLLSPTTAALAGAPLAGAALVVNPHACGAIGDVGVLSRTALGRLRLRAAVARADAFVAVSRTIRDELIAAGAAPERVWAISNGVDLDRFSPAGATERSLLRALLSVPDAPRVIYTGRLSAEKGVDVLVEAWPRVLREVPAARLAIVGSGPDEASLRARARSLGLDRSVTFEGACADVAPSVRASDVAVLPSRTEGMPVALLEAMACAVPVVATRVGGSAEVVEDGVTGWLVPPEDPGALASALALVLRDPSTARRRADAARAAVVERRSITAVADRFLTLYGAVVSRRAADVRGGAAATHPR